MSGKNVVTATSSLQCGKAPGHEGTVTAKGQTLLTIGGAGVLVETDLLAASIAGCKNPTLSSTNVQCSAVANVSAGSMSHCLTVGGKPVVLDAPLAGETVGTPKGTPTAVDVKQNLLTAE